MSPPEQHFFDLSSLPLAAVPNRVTAVPTDRSGRRALKVEVTQQARDGAPGVDYVDTDTFVILPVPFRNGRIEVDVLGRTYFGAPPGARGFIGLAYRISPDHQTFESVYVRPLNGRKHHPPPPRHQRAIQYFAFPDWRFDRLRDQYPDGRFEAGADIASDEWISLCVDIYEDHVQVTVNGEPLLTVREPKADPVVGAIGLWVDIGTEGYFSNLRIAPSEPKGEL
jgi:hypothetical protein